MRIIQVFNRHRGGGGADNNTDAIIELLRQRGVEQEVMEYDSNDLAPGLRGKINAFTDGIYTQAPARRLAERIREFKPDLIHVWELYPMISPWILPVCKELGVPVVMYCSDYRLSCPVATHFSKGEVCTRCVGGREHWAVLRNCRESLLESTAFALRSAVAHRKGLFRKYVDHYITPTEFTADWISEQVDVPRDRLTAIPCLVSMPDQPVEDPSQGLHVGFAARFVVEKGIDTIVEAVREAGLPLVIALTEPAELPLRPTDDIRIIVTHNRAELDAFYRSCRIVVMPSLWFESFGLVAAEGMSHGLPVVSSRIGALAEVSRDGVTGLLAEPGDASDLARCLRRIWDDAELCREMGRGARDHIAKLTDPDTHFESLMGVYERVASSSP